MNLVSIHRAKKEIAGKLLYDDISFGIDSEDKIALIGVNGSGKSTLLKILAGLDEFDDGDLTTNREFSCGYLKQTTLFTPGQTVSDFIFDSSNRRMQVLHAYLDAQQKLARGEVDDLSEIEAEMTALDVYRLESDAREILSHLKINDMNIPMSELSGGMQKKVALAQVLIEDSNLLLLDEPTNHLDIDSIAWLENYLLNMKKAVVIITHDRYFLDNVVNHILEIDNQGISKYEANYSAFLEKKAEIAEIEKRTLARHQNILTKELKWLSRMPKARGSKQKARIQQIEKRQQEVNAIKPETERARFHSSEERLGKNILELINVSRSFEGVGEIFSNFSYDFQRGQRIAIIGDNGAGKTTFLKLLMKEIETETGKVKHGVNTRIGYLSQQNKKIDEHLTVMNAVKEIANYIEVEDGAKITAGQFLERFLFNNPGQKVNRLSGGERRRLEIIRLLMTNPNFLILDEPTNDLDLQTLAILEEYLLEFKGCLLVTSHDRYFLDKLAGTLFVFEKGSPIQVINSRCSDYLQEVAAKEKTSPASKPKKGKDKKKGPKVKLSYKEERRKKEIEALMPRLEEELKELEQKLGSGETDHEKLAQWGTLQVEKEKELMGLLTELEAIEGQLLQK